jgi:hypothetical protein
MFNTFVVAGAVGVGAASRYGSGSDQMMQLLAAPAPQHCVLQENKNEFLITKIRKKHESMVMCPAFSFKSFAFNRLM